VVAPPAAATVTHYKATLDYSQVTGAPPGEIPSKGHGTAALDFDDATLTLTGTITYAGLSGPPTAMHLHQGRCGELGIVLYSLGTELTSPVAVNLTLSAEDAVTLAHRGIYTQAHTDEYPWPSEIRGQIVAADDPFVCPLDDGGVDRAFEDAGPEDAGGPAEAGAGAVDAAPPAPYVVPASHVTCDSVGTGPGSGLLVTALGLALVGALRQVRRRRH
jgi:MYXO-CTERM domain-containing protein